MKLNTGKLYELMSSEEKANIYQASSDQAERDKILASIPKLTYKALDYDFKNRVNRLQFEQLTLMIDWFKTLLLLTEAYHEGLHMGSNDKRLVNLYLSKLAALEEALDPNHKEVLAAMGQDIDVAGYAMVYELEVQPELVEQFNRQLKETREEVINEMYF